jgi:hypothetical protein
VPDSFPEHDLFANVGIQAGALGAALTESWVAIVTTGSGAGGSLWRSDVGLLNRSALPNSVRMRVEAADEVEDLSLELAVGQHLVLDDVMTELGLAGSGSLRVLSSEPLTVTSRTYNTGDGGTFGQYLGGVTGPGGLGNGDTAVLMHLREDSPARSNLGVLNAGRRQALVRVALFDGSGAEVVSFLHRVDPREVEQLNRPFAVHGGRTDVSGGYAVVTVVEGEEVVAYGSVVDAGTNDPTTTPMKRGQGSTRTFVAAAAHADGVAGSVWRTDLGVLNVGVEATPVTVVYRTASAQTLTLDLQLGPGEQVMLDDIVGRIGGEGSGSLEVVSQRPILVSSRTFNQGSDGTYGQYLDGHAGSAMASTGDTVWLPQLQQDDAFRTNIGLLNSGSEQATAVLRLHDQLGALLATSELSVAGGDRLQLNEPFDRLAGRSDIDSGYATVEITQGSGIVAYASVVDNRTNDPTTVPMVR